MTPKQVAAKIRHYANYELWEGSLPREGYRYTCTILAMVEIDIAATALVAILREHACDCGVRIVSTQEFDEFDSDVERQAARYLWLHMFANYIEDLEEL